MENANAGITRSRRIKKSWRGVCRSIVDADYLNVIKGLACQTFEALSEIAFNVVNRDDNRNQRIRHAQLSFALVYSHAAFLTK